MPPRIAPIRRSPSAGVGLLALAMFCGLSTPPLRAAFDPNNPIPEAIPHGPLRVDFKAVVADLVAPVLLLAAPDASKRLFILDQPGQIWIVKNGKRNAAPFLDVSARMVELRTNYDERGLLGLAFDPGFADPQSAGYGRIFTYTSEPVTGTADLVDQYATSLNHHGVVASWRVSAADPDVIDPATRVEILRVDQPQSNHNGGTIAFGPDGHLYFALGDGGGANDNNANGHNPTIGNGQDVTIALGKMLRIDVNGTNSSNGKYGIPSTNPYAAGGGLPEIYALGLRNPYRFSFDGADLLVADVGQNRVEELNRVELGKNYGWRYKEGTFKFDPATGTVSDDLTGLPEGLIDPILQYDHDEGVSITGGFVYRGNAIPELRGKYVFADYSRNASVPLGRLFYGDLTTGEIREFVIGDTDAPLGVFIKGIGLDADGEIYALVSVPRGPDASSGFTGVALKLVPPSQYITGGTVPFAGVSGSGVPADATFKTLGVPSINDAGELAFSAEYASAAGNRAVIVGPRSGDRSTTAVLLTAGDPAPDSTGLPLAGNAAFRSFDAPLLDGEGTVAFTAKLMASTKLSGNSDEGLWSNAGGSLRLVAREGTPAPGADGAKFKKFTSAALGSSSDGESTLAFVAQLAATGGSKITKQNDLGLWLAQEASAPELVLREGQTLNVRGGDHKVKSLKTLSILAGAPGQGNGVAQKRVIIHATFSDGFEALLRAGSDADLAVIAASGDPELESTLRSFSSVTQSTSATAAFIASLNTDSKANNAAVFIENDDLTLESVAKKGDPAPGTDSAFSSFNTVVRSSDGGAAFLATLKGGTAGATTNSGLWWVRDSGFSLLAREGSEAPIPGGIWHSFQSIALSDRLAVGPLFVAKLRPAGPFTARNNIGVWSTDASGELHLVLSTGDSLSIGSETKTIRAFTVLSVVPGSPAQARSYNSSARLVYRAFFTDGSQAIESVTLP